MTKGVCGLMISEGLVAHLGYFVQPRCVVWLENLHPNSFKFGLLKECSGKLSTLLRGTIRHIPKPLPGQHTPTSPQKLWMALIVCLKSDLSDSW